MQRPDPKTLLPMLAAVAAVYTAAVLFSIETVASTQIWPASGVALAALLRWGPVALLALVPAHLLAHLAAGVPPGFAIAAAAVAGLQTAGTAWLLLRLRFDRSFASTRDVASFALVGVVGGSAFGAALGTAALAATGQTASSGAVASARNWWIANGVGVLLIAPALLLAGRLRDTVAARSSAAELVLLGAALVAVCLAVFGPVPGLGAANHPTSYAVLPVVAWAAYRLGPPGAAAANLVVAPIAVWGTLGGFGPFAHQPREEGVFFTWAFLAVGSVASLALGALVAARDRTERELRTAYEALNALETATRAGSWMWRPESRLHLASARQRELHGVAEYANPVPEEALLERIHPDDRRRVIQEFASAWDARARIDTEYRVVLPDGSVRWLAVGGGCVAVDRARPEGRLQMVGVHVDVTARKQLEAELRRGERLASLGTFAAGVAHELNNPLGTILLAAESARTASDDRDGVARALDDIVDDAQRAARIVRSVLRFAKEEPTERARLDLRDALERAVDLARPTCRERGVGLELRRAPQPLHAVANATEIEQLVQNLVRNAAEACERGGRIRVEAEPVGDEVLVTVKDDGRGMTAGEVEHAFDPFYTTRAREGGSGLGLSICHGIVEAHGGRIEIETAPGYGTSVRVRLPGAAAEDPDAMGGAADGTRARR